MNPSLAMPEEGMTLNELSNFVAEQLKRLNLVLKNIDGLNIVDIKFELQGGAYIQLNRKGLVFNNGTFDTLKVDINGKVSATAMDLSTTPDSYPRVEINSGANLLAAYKSATDYLTMNPNLTDSPTFIFNNGAIIGNIGNTSTRFWINGILGIVRISSNNHIEISASGQVKFDSWSNIYSSLEAKTLKQELDSIKSRLSALETP